MTKVLVCNVCGRVGDPTELPPFVEPCRWQTAIEDYAVDLCRDCQQTKTLREILEHAEGSPGGTLQGSARGPYLVIRE